LIIKISSYNVFFTTSRWIKAAHPTQIILLAEYDDSGAIGRRYRRQDEIGTPFAVTVDYDTKENNTVTLRDRDSMKQVRVAIDELPETVSALIAGSTTFAELG